MSNAGASPSFSAAPEDGKKMETEEEEKFEKSLSKAGLLHLKENFVLNRVC